MKITLTILALALSLAHHAQTSSGCNLNYISSVGGVSVYKRSSSNTIMFKSKFVIDADGSPRAYGPSNSGLDYTANAGYPGNWWGGSNKFKW